MIRYELDQIFQEFGLVYKDEQGNELPFADVLAQIYLFWDKQKLQQFMNSIMAIELNGGGDPFERTEH